MIMTLDRGGDLGGERGMAPSKILGGGDGAAYISQKIRIEY